MTSEEGSKLTKSEIEELIKDAEAKNDVVAYERYWSLYFGKSAMPTSVGYSVVPPFPPLVLSAAADEYPPPLKPSTSLGSVYYVDSFAECLLLLQMATWLKPKTIFHVAYRHTGNRIELLRGKSQIRTLHGNSFVKDDLLNRYDNFEPRSQQAMIVNKFVYELLQKLGIEK